MAGDRCTRRRGVQQCAMRRRFFTLLALSIVSTTGVAWAAEPAVVQKFYEVRGVKLYTERFGQGPPLVFLHGGLHFFDNSFEHQRDYFAAFRTVIGIDQRGHGHSPDNAAPFDYEEMAADTAALIKLLGIGPVDVIGHSDGGNVALLLARRHPELVRRLVVSGANLRANVAGLSPEDLERNRRRTPQEISARLPPAFQADYSRVSPDGPQHWLTVVAKSWQLWLTPVVIEPADLKTIQTPVLVVAGDHDFTSLEEITEMYRALPHGQLLILPATGHPTFSERPELLNPAMRAFLEAPDAATAK
jgi:pimeloyl-ACP methyl ester carboxylesterase